MQAFLVKKRRKVPPDPPEDQNATAKRVGAAVFAILFGSLFLFLELYGKCKCSMDIVGMIFLIPGIFIVLFYCIKDYVTTWREETTEDFNDSLELELDSVEEQSSLTSVVIDGNNNSSSKGILKSFTSDDVSPHQPDSHVSWENNNNVPSITIQA